MISDSSATVQSIRFSPAAVAPRAGDAGATGHVGWRIRADGFGVKCFVVAAVCAMRMIARMIPIRVSMVKNNVELTACWFKMIGAKLIKLAWFYFRFYSYFSMWLI